MNDKKTKSAKLIVKGDGFNTPIFLEIDNELYRLENIISYSIHQKADDYMKVTITTIPLCNPYETEKRNELVLNISINKEELKLLADISKKVDSDN